MHKWTKESIIEYKNFIFLVPCRPVFTHGPPGPGPRAANFQGRHINKIEIEVWYAEKNELSAREIFKGYLY